MATYEHYPQKAYINAITNAQHAVVTFTEDHDFTVGEILSFRVGRAFGTFQMNNQRGIVLTTTNDTVTVTIDSSDWDVFDYSVLNDPGTSPPVALPCWSGIVPGSQPSRVNLLDAFDNRRA